MDKRTLIKRISVVFIFNVLAAIAAYATRIILARSLTPAEYGLFYSVLTFFIFFLFFRDLGLGKALVRFIPKWNVEKKYNTIKTAIVSVFLCQFVSSLIFAVVFFLSAHYLATFYFKDPRAVKIIYLLIIYVITSILFTNMKNIFQGFQRMKWYALVECSKNTFILIMTIIFLSLGFGLFAPVWAFVIISSLLFVLFVPYAAKSFPFQRYEVKEKSNVIKQLFAFGIPVIFTGIGGKVIGYIDTLLLTHYSTLEQVGIYNAILPSALLILFVGKSVQAVIYPFASELIAKGEYKHIHHGLATLYLYGGVILITVIGLLIFFAHHIISLLFGSAYTSGTLAFQIILIGTGFFLIASITNSIIAAAGKPAWVTGIIIGAAIINTIINIILIPHYGITGAAVATTISYIFVFIVSTHLVKRSLT
jgi:O-antigen/teichoic acid export membrane protein